MDANNIVTAFVTSANQYAVNQSENNFKQLQRHLEILVCLTSEECNLSYFQNRTLISSQCVTHVINVLLDGSAKQPLLSRALSVLQNLLKNSAIFKSLQCTFHLHSALSTFLQNYGINTKDPLVIQCLHILEEITYNIKIDYIEHHFENFILALLKLIDTDTSQGVKVYFHILSNICRKNPKIQMFICSLTNLKQIVKKLISLLNFSVPGIVLYSLSILSSIAPYNNFGSKLWTDEHLIMTFDLIAKLLFCDDDSCVTTAIDLFDDLIAVKKHQQCFVKSPNFARCLRKVSKSLDQAPMKRVVLYLRFFMSVAGIPETLEKLCSVLCVPFQNSKNLNIHPMLMKWCAESGDFGSQLRGISLKLVWNILSLYKNGNFCYVEDSVKIILQSIFKSMQVPTSAEDNLREEYLKGELAVFEIIALCSKSNNLKGFISQHIDIQVCEEIAKFVLDKCSVDGTTCYEKSVDLFLMIMEILSCLEVVGLDQILERILQNFSAMQCLSYALTSNNSELISRGVTLISLSGGKYSLSLLSENLHTRNVSLYKSISQSSENNSQSYSSDMMPSAPKKPHLSISKSSEKSIDSLLSKIENGLQIKDLKSSEIMDLYEHKIAMLTLKEQELQSYVDAKTAALQEADRLITQYKCRHADADAEALRLRSMMKDYECRSEQSASQLVFAEQKQRKVEANLVEAQQRIKEMEQNLNEQKEMTHTQMNRLSEQKKNVEEEKARLGEQLAAKDQEKKTLAGQLQTVEEELRLRNKAFEDLAEAKDEVLKMLEETKKSAEKAKMNSEQKQLHLQKLIDTAQQATAALEEKNESLMNEMAKKTDDFSHQISDLESEKEQLSEQLKLKDGKIEDLAENLRKLNETLNERVETLQKREDTLTKLKVTLEQTEGQRKKLQQDKKMLELLCKKYEGSIEEKDSQIQTITEELDVLRKEYDDSVSDKDAQIKHLQDELAKHEYITGMIHNLTSGKLAPPK